jgi:hypothetical protein
MQILQGMQARNSQKFAIYNSTLTDNPGLAGKNVGPCQAFSRFRDRFRYPKIHQQSAGDSVFNMPVAER